MAMNQAVLDMTRKAYWDKFSLEVIFIWSPNGKQISVRWRWNDSENEGENVTSVKEISKDIHI